MTINPDQLYQKDRKDLLKYEDARFNSLIQAVANYYTSSNDQTIWGAVLRTMAQELARLEYDYAYDIVTKDPRYLTPPDMIRRWEDPLFISRNFPAKDQFDLDFKLMIQRLLVAYRQGAKVTSIQQVIFAYTLQTNIVVEELYKEIGQFFDQSDRNAIRVAVKVGSLTGSTSLAVLPSVTADLYGAIDQIKPAHVGLNLTTIFGEDENIDAYIVGDGQSPPSIVGIQDSLRIYFRLEEEEPFPPQLTLSPLFDTTSPDTRLIPSGSPPHDGVLAPRLDRAWEISGENVSILNED